MLYRNVNFLKDTNKKNKIEKKIIKIKKISTLTQWQYEFNIEAEFVSIILKYFSVIPYYIINTDTNHKNTDSVF